MFDLTTVLGSAFSLLVLEGEDDDIFIMEWNNLDERVNMFELCALALIETLSGCLTEYWLVLLKSFEVLFKTFSSSHMVKDWHMIMGDELADDEEEDVFSTNFFSFVASLAAFVGSCLYDEDEDNDALGDMLFVVVVIKGIVHLELDDEDSVEACSKLVFISLVVENEVDDEEHEDF